MTASGWRNGCVLVLGAEGMLGRALARTLRRTRIAPATSQDVYLGRDELDICDASALLDCLREHTPHGVGQSSSTVPPVLFNAAAYTDVDGCEKDVERAFAVNAQGPGNVAQACARTGALLVHFGTDYVFDGNAERPYQPDDPARPLSVYGRSKWEGEKAVRASGCQCLIVRTSWLFGPRDEAGALSYPVSEPPPDVGRPNFVESILRKAQQGGSLRVVNDQTGRPTYAADLADAVCRLLDVDARGTVHFANGGSCSRFEFAQEIVRQAGLDVSVQPMSSAELSDRAPRPAYSVLDTSAYTQLTGDEPAPWSDALARYLSEVRSAKSEDRRDEGTQE